MTTTTIILIDDDLSVNYFHRRLITLLNLSEDVHTFNGKQALEGIVEINKTAMSGQKALIFLDLNMPLMSGWEFLEEFEKLKENLNIICRIHVISASLNPVDKERAEQNPNVINYIGKPLSKETLMNCI